MRSKLSNLTRTFTRALALTAACAVQVTGHPAFAADGRDALEFRELLRSSLAPESRTDAALAQIHLVPDANVLAATDASDIKTAIEKVKLSSLAALTNSTKSLGAQSPLDADKALSQNPLTIVIVPGIFGEFIPTRGFEDVLSQPSAARDEFKTIVEKAANAGDANAKDKSFDLKLLAEKDLQLNELMHIGSIKGNNGTTVARLVLLFTPFMSLESMGSLKDHAETFNRRLSKYIALTGPQNLALVGYSRGTDLALEMLAQAQAQSLPYLKSVKAMVSLGGVAWGSTLADDAFDPKSPMNAAINEIITLRNGLNPDSVEATLIAWAKFGKNILLLAPKLMHKDVKPKSAELQNSPIGLGLDFTSLMTLVKLFFTQLGLSHPSKDFAGNVKRFQTLVDSVLDGVTQLTSKARTEWWTSHALPKSLTYYSITGAMANPEKSDEDKTAFFGPFGYSNSSYDDLMLLQNRLDYETSSGIALNDSQVSVAQAMILPAAAARLNPANSGLKSEFLGTVGTHHWGLALRVVNAMNDGRMNPFPREALIKALAAKIALDSSKEAAK